MKILKNLSSKTHPDAARFSFPHTPQAVKNVALSGLALGAAFSQQYYLSSYFAKLAVGR